MSDQASESLSASAALSKRIEQAHPDRDLRAREQLAAGMWPSYSKGWIDRGVADQLPDHAAPAAELEPEPAGEPAPDLLPPGWGPDVEAEYQALLQLMAGPPGERREGFLRLRHPRRLDL